MVMGATRHELPVDKRSYINFLRGVAIFLMLWGHCVQYCCDGQVDFFEDVAFKMIYSFHMPLFMLISGYLFYASAMRRSLYELVEHRAKAMLYPILMCSLLNLLLTSGVVVLVRKGAGFTSLFGAVPMTSLWFLWSVLSCSVTLALATKVPVRPLLRAVLVIVGLGFVALFPCWEMNVWMYPYFVVGYLVARNEAVFARLAKPLGAACAMAFLALLPFFAREHYIYTSGLNGGASLAESFSIDAFRWAIGLVGSMVAVGVSMLAFRRLGPSNAVRRALEALGRDSLAVYALSVSLLSFWLPQIAGRLLRLLPWLDLNACVWAYDFVLTPCVAVGYAMLLLWAVRLLRRHGLYRLVFGR